VVYFWTTLVAHFIKCAVTECWINLKYAKENGRGLEVFSQHFPVGGTEENHENFENSQSVGRDWRKIS
jgi:hypothetical protein